MSLIASGHCWGPDFPAESDLGVSASTVRLVALALADVVNDMHGNEFYGSVKKVAEKVGLGRGTVGIALKHLVVSGVLTVMEIRPGGTVRYRWNLLGRTTTAGDAGLEEPARTYNHPCSDVQPGGARTYARDTNRTEDKPKLSRESEITTRSELPLAVSEKFDKIDPFDGFWKAYPRKVGKPAARKAWRAAVRRDGLDSIRTGFKRWAAYWKADSTDPRFIPHPATWLNGERYNDATDATEAAGSPVLRPAWYADPQCPTCNGDGLMNHAAEGDPSILGPCPCRRADPYTTTPVSDSGYVATDSAATRERNQRGQSGGVL